MEHRFMFITYNSLLRKRIVFFFQDEQSVEDFVSYFDDLDGWQWRIYEYDPIKQGFNLTKSGETKGQTMTQTQVYDALIKEYGEGDFKLRMRAGYALYNEYGFTADLSRIRIIEAPGDNGNVIRFMIGRHAYTLAGNKLEKED